MDEDEDLGALTIDSPQPLLEKYEYEENENLISQEFGVKMVPSMQEVEGSESVHVSPRGRFDLPALSFSSLPSGITNYENSELRMERENSGFFDRVEDKEGQDGEAEDQKGQENTLDTIESEILKEDHTKSKIDSEYTNERIDLVQSDSKIERVNEVERISGDNKTDTIGGSNTDIASSSDMESQSNLNIHTVYSSDIDMKVTETQSNPPVLPALIEPTYTFKDIFATKYEKASKKTKPKSPAKKFTTEVKKTIKEAGAANKTTTNKHTDGIAKKTTTAPVKEKPAGSRRARNEAAKPYTAANEAESANKPLVVSTTRTISPLQLSILEAECKQLSQRNARLQTQVTTLTNDLVRSKATVATLTTENQLLTAKLPLLQRQLLEETDLLDQKQAQSTQSLLELNQWRAKAHVLHTQHDAIQATLEKTQIELRKTRNELKRKSTLHDELDEKLKQLVLEHGENKRVHQQEMMQLKQKLQNAVRRAETERVHIASETKKNANKQYEQLKGKVVTIQHKNKELERRIAVVEQEKIQQKLESDARELELREKFKGARAMKVALKRATEVEEMLRKQLSSLRLQFRVSEQANRKLAVSRIDSTSRRHLAECNKILSTTRQIESKGLEHESSLLCQSCTSLLYAAETTIDSKANSCSSCVILKKEQQVMRAEISRLRKLHVGELEAMAYALKLATNCA